MKAQMTCFIDLALASRSDDGFRTEEVARCSCKGKHSQTTGTASNLDKPIIDHETVGYTRAEWLDLIGEASRQVTAPARKADEA